MPGLGADVGAGRRPRSPTCWRDGLHASTATTTAPTVDARRRRCAASTSTWPTFRPRARRSPSSPRSRDDADDDHRRRLHPRQGERPARRPRAPSCARPASTPTEPTDGLRDRAVRRCARRALGTHHDHRLAMAFGVLGLRGRRASRSTIPTWCRRAGPGSGRCSTSLARERRDAVVAAFDVDGTLTTRDCVVPFLARSAAGGAIAAALAAPAASTRRRAAFAATATRSRRSSSAACCAAARSPTSTRPGAPFAASASPATGCAPTRRPAALAPARRATGSCSCRRRSAPYLGRSAELLGVDDVLCTDVGRRRRRATGRARRRRTAAARRRSRRLHAWLDEPTGLRRRRAVGLRRQRRRPRAAGRCADHPGVGRPAPTSLGRAADGRPRDAARAARARRGPKQWVKNVLVFAAPGAAGVLDHGRRCWPHDRHVRRVLPRQQRHLLLERHPRRRGDRLPPDQALPPDRQRRDPDRRRPASSARCCSSSGSAWRSTGRWQAGAVVAVYVVLTLTYSADLEAHRRDRPHRRRRRLRAAGHRRRGRPSTCR